MVISVVSTITGTWVAISFMDTITGAAVTTGTIKLEVNASTSCTATDSTINLGNITRGNYNRSEEIDGTPDTDFVVIENNGNVLLNITGYSTSDLFDSSAAPTQNWTMQCNVSQSGTCVNGFKIINSSVGTAETLVNDLVTIAATDEMNVSVNATVPIGESSGMKTGTITFVCTYSG